MAAYLKIITTWKSKFFRCNFIQVPKSENSYVVSLATLASTVVFQFRCEVPLRYIPSQASTTLTRKFASKILLRGGGIYIIAHLKDETLPGDKTEAQKLQHLATRFLLFDDLLYKKYSKLSYDPYLM